MDCSDESTHRQYRCWHSVPKHPVEYEMVMCYPVDKIT